MCNNYFPIFREKLLLKSSTYKPEKSGAGARGSPSVAKKEEGSRGESHQKKTPLGRASRQRGAG